jgi:hypothetical protein
MENGRFHDHRPTVISLDPPRRIVLAAAFGHRRFVYLVHSFFIEEVDGGLRLRQTWDATGLLIPILWPVLTKMMARFQELGEGLAGWVARESATGSPGG